MKAIVVLISGRGSNMAAIATACAAERWPARIAAVISSRADARGLATARELGLAVEVLESRDFSDRAAFDEALAGRVQAYRPDVVALAGFMRILSDRFVDRFRGRLVNIHPSLLPAFPGLNTHARALAAGVAVHGATVHLVTAELDGGPIVAQAVVPVRATDDAASLAARVLEAEHRLYPRVLRWMVEGRVGLVAGRVALRDPVPGERLLAIGLATGGPDAAGPDAAGPDAAGPDAGAS
ncbi:MAG TPA: phosphoribosylglycinamide formyltransferase [Burkholderiaceae bacterium]